MGPLNSHVWMISTPKRKHRTLGVHLGVPKKFIVAHLTPSGLATKKYVVTAAKNDKGALKNV